MALTGRQTVFGIVVTYLALLLIFEFMPPMAPTSVLTLEGIIGTAVALFLLVSAALMKLGKLKAGSWWGRSAIVNFWQGIAWLCIGLGHFSHLVIADSLAAAKVKLYAVLAGIAAMLVGIAAMLVERRRAPVVGKI